MVTCGPAKASRTTASPVAAMHCIKITKLYQCMYSNVEMIREAHLMQTFLVIDFLFTVGQIYRCYCEPI